MYIIYSIYYIQYIYIYIYIYILYIITSTRCTEYTRITLTGMSACLHSEEFAGKTIVLKLAPLMGSGETSKTPELK